MATRVQTASNSANGVSTINVVMGSNITAGNKVVLLCKYGADFTPAAGMVTDTLSGDAWTLEWSAANLTVGVTTLADHAVYSKTFASGGACTITFNPATSSGRIAAVAREYSGLGTHDGSTRSITNLTTSGTPSSGNITPSSANGVIFAFVSSSQTQTWEAEYGDATGETVNGRFHTAVDESVTAAAQAADTTQSSSSWDCGAIWFPDAGGGGGGSTANNLTLLGVG